MYVNSNERKLKLSSWLKYNQRREFSSNLKLQKFLFFYEVFSKIDEEKDYDFSYLRAYPNGPVFSNVYGDYNYQTTAFWKRLDQLGAPSIEGVNYERAKLAGFLVKILNEEELSDVTHEFDAWKKYKGAIKRGEKNITILEDDFTQNDFFLLETLREMYPIELIENSEVISILDKNFIISKDILPRLTKEQKDLFLTLADENLHNPVFIDLTEEGVMLVD